MSQYGQLNGSLSLDGTSIRSHFKDILYNQVNILHPDSLALMLRGVHPLRIGLEWQVLQRIQQDRGGPREGGRRESFE